MISIHRFSYAGYSSEDFDLCCQLSFDNSTGETSTFLSREAVASETYRGEIQRVSSYKYTDVLAPTITLIDKNFGDFDIDRQRKILKWLTSKNMPSFMTVFHDDSGVVSYEMLGNWTEISTYKLGSGRVVGFQCVFSSISPYAYSPLYTYSQSVVNIAHQKFTIELNSDNENAIYPRVTIKQHNSVLVYVDKPMIVNNAWVDSDYIDGTVYYYDVAGDYYYNKHNADGSIVATVTKTNPVTTSTKTSVIIKSVNTDEYGKVHTSYLRIKNNSAGETIVLDGANRVVSSSATKRVFGNDFMDWQWLQLYNGKNEITVIGNCTVTLEYRCIRKIGSY